MNNSYHILNSLLAPAILMAATGSLLLSANNRLARVVDRLRVLMANWKAGTRDQPARELQIQRHRKRSNYLLRACLYLYFALGSFIGTSLALAVDTLSGNRISVLPTIIGIVGMCFLLGAVFYLGREVFAAVKSFDDEIKEEMD
ncbi:MAG TPA: DUF2721 domain-containing protein [Arenimonas sp.]|nr:DUF2721 domain-containing protein [Arenimonas sp.]